MKSAGQRAVMGVELRDVPQGEGALIDRVSPDMPADKAGLAAGDVVVELDGVPVTGRQALSDAQSQAHRAFTMAHDQFLAGSVSNLDLLTTEQALVSADAAVAASDAALIQDQIAVFKALGGGWRGAEPNATAIAATR